MRKGEQRTEKGRAENGERESRERRKGLRPEEFEDYKEKEAKRKNLNRSNEKAVPGPVKAHRASKCRAKAKQGASMVTTPDLSEQVVGKAVSRLRQSLPKSPQRHFTVVKKLAGQWTYLNRNFRKYHMSMYV